MDWIPSIVSAVTGGILAITGVLLSACLTTKTKTTEWKRTEKYNIYIDTINILLRLKIPCFATEEAVSAKELELDIYELQLWVGQLRTFIEENNARLYLFLPKNIYKRILIVSNNVVSITENPKSQKIPFEELKKSKIYESILIAHTVAKDLKCDLNL